MVIQQVTTKDVLPIRHRVLWPDQLPSFCEVKEDDSAIHYGALVNGMLVCVASIYYLEARKARLRKFATLPEYQGQGIGSKLIEHLIGDLKSAQTQYFWCDARTSAVSFYQKFGLGIEGEPFQKSGVSYLRMSIQWN